MKQLQPSYPVLYTLTGAVTSISHRRYCSKCNTTLTAFNKNDKYIKVEKVFKASDQSLYAVEFLDTLLPWISIAGVNFQELCKHYTFVWSHKTKFFLDIPLSKRLEMNGDRLEEAFFKYQ
jgi:hypothetical protein